MLTPQTTNPVGFQPYGETQQFVTQASATNLSGFTVNQDYDPEIETYIRRETVFWQLIKNKRPANSPIVKKIREGALPNVGYVDKADLTPVKAPPLQNNPVALQNDLGDPGQEVKAVAGSVYFNHFGRSMAAQQNNPYDDTVAEDTDDLLTSMSRFLEMQLFKGDATAEPLSFNGLDKLMDPANVITCDVTGSDPDNLVDVINRAVTRATTDRTIMRRLTHIMSTGSGSLQFQREVGQAVFYQNTTEVVPGFKVPGIMTSNGQLPIVSTPYIDDLDGGAGNDTIRVYVLDINSLEWRGVPPFGGSDSLEPQIFDITQYFNGVPLVEHRMALIYGTMYAKDRGRGIFRIDCRVEPGTVWNVAGT